MGRARQIWQIFQAKYKFEHILTTILKKKYWKFWREIKKKMFIRREIVENWYKKGGH